MTIQQLHQIVFTCNIMFFFKPFLASIHASLTTSHGELVSELMLSQDEMDGFLKMKIPQKFFEQRKQFILMLTITLQNKKKISSKFPIESIFYTNY